MREHLGEFRLTAMCRVLGVNRSGYYAWAGNSGIVVRMIVFAALSSTPGWQAERYTATASSPGNFVTPVNVAAAVVFDV